MKSSGCLGCVTLLVGLLGLVSPVAGQSGSCPDLGGVIAGCILGTLGVVGIIIAIVLLVQRKKRKAKAATRTGDAGLQQAHVNPAFQDETLSSPEKPTEKANDISFAEKGFGGYVQCKEYTSTTKKEEPSPPRINGNVQPKWSPKPTKLPTYGIGGKMTKTGSRGSLDDGYPSLAVHSSAIELSKMHSLDPEVINVALQSQDIIGLGFNICGNLRDGIYVSQVHNRGPASESGRIKPGDRILGITISFENTVYEDALTILSYASPYPVQLQIQKKQQKSDSDVTGEDYEEALHLHHPVYRSQSMDDVSKIAQESVFRVRRARSEMKRGSSKSRKQEEEIEEGKLRKWSGKPDFGEPVSTTDITSDEKSEDSNVSIPDLRIDASGLLHRDETDGEVIEATVHHDADSHSLDIGHNSDGGITLEDINLEKTEAPTLGLSPKRQSELDRMEGLRLSYEADMPAVRKLELEKKAASETLEEVKDAVDGDKDKDVNANVGINLGKSSFGLRGKRHDSGASNSSSASETKAVPAEKIRRISTAETDEARSSGDEEAKPKEGETSIQFVPDVGQEVSLVADTSSRFILTEHDDFIDIDLKSSKRELTSDDVPSGPPSPPPGPPPPLSDNAADVTESSMHVLLNEDSIMMRDASGADDEADVSASGGQTNDGNDSIQDVLKDYFSDQPSLMARLGLSSGKGNLENVTLPKRLSASDNRSERSSDHDSVASSGTNTNGKALHEAKMLIRQKSSSDEEPAHASSSPSLSSRSSSPTELADQTYVQEAGSDQEGAVEETRMKKPFTLSPVVTKRSSGGLSFDVNPSDYQDMEVDTEEQNRKQQGGVAYYVSIEDQFHGAPVGEVTGGVDDNQPSLVRAWDMPNMSATPHYDVDDLSQETTTTTRVSEVRMIGTGETTTTTTTTTTKVLELSNNNNDLGVNGNEKGNEAPLSTALRSKDLQTEVSKSSEVITVIPHEEVPGAFTLTMNTSHHEDSEA